MRVFNESECSDVLITVGSMHHLMSALTYLEGNRELLRVKSISVLCESFLNKQFAPDLDVLERVAQDYSVHISVHDFKIAIKKLPTIITGNARSLVYITPRFFSLNIYGSLRIASGSDCDVVWVECEEGLGSYRSFGYVFLVLLKDIRIKALLKYTLNYLFSQVCVSSKVRFLNRGAKFETYSDSAKTLKALYQRYYIGLRGGGSGDSNLMLFASQPVVELGWMSEESYLRFMAEVEADAQSKGFRFLIKAHPSESLEKYDPAKLYQDRGEAFEQVLVGDKKIMAVAGICSTALYTAKLVKSLQTHIYVEQVLFDRFYKGSDKQFLMLRHLADNFVKI